ncbi:MAG: hypothetical protein AAF787_22870 [Chloroflexota bacterium]
MNDPKDTPYNMTPPVMTVRVEDAMDIMIVRDTTRRAAGLVGFTPAHRAQLSSAAATLAELVLKTGEVHTIRMNGVSKGMQRGLQISLTTPWLAGVSANNVLLALKSKLGELVDEIMLKGDNEPTIIMVMWLNADRQKATPDDG